MGAELPKTCLAFAIFCCLPLCRLASGKDTYVIDSSVGLGRRFDGVGAISGGGATSRLLINYPEPQRSQVLDYLFKPKHGASLQILKVEIGGDVQSTEGTESSHMHTEDDENYQRGYEWWIMTEAKKRNPAIKLIGLPWGFPGWLGDTYWPFVNNTRLADYVVRWIQGAHSHYNLTIDYIGIWNERPYDPEYIKVLRKMLNKRGFSHVKIIVGDELLPQSWEIVHDMAKDPELKQVVDIVGVHYPGTLSPDEAKNCSKPLWSSEDYSGTADDTGAASISRLVNQNYVNGLMTSTIAWNMLAAYYDDLPIPRHSLMVAQQPWSGYYEVNPPVWATAHTTHFTEIGWHYLKHGAGVYQLKQHGSMVSFVSPDNKQLTIVIETMDTTKHDACLRGLVRPYRTLPQNVTLQLKGKLAQMTALNVWYSKLGFGKEKSTYFQYEGQIKVVNGALSLSLQPDEIYTLTSVDSPHQHSRADVPAPPPRPKPFPLPYKDDFEAYPEHGEANNFAQQVGSFEVLDVGGQGHRKVMRQMVPRVPIHWCPIGFRRPLNVIGNFNWSNIEAHVDVRVPASMGADGVFIALHINHYTGCTSMLAQGIFFFIRLVSQSYMVTRDIGRGLLVKQGPVSLSYQQWYTMSLSHKDGHVVAALDGQVLFNGTVSSKLGHGFAGLGADNYAIADFDNFMVLPS